MLTLNRIPGPLKCPCKDCTDRTLTCHGFCTRYKEWKEELEKKNEARRTETARYAISDTKKKWLRKQARRNHGKSKKFY